MAESETPDGEGAEPVAETDEQPAADPEPDLPLAEEEFSVEGIMRALHHAPVSELILSSVSTLASVAYGKLEEGNLVESKLAIDAVGALLPLLASTLEPGVQRDFEQALAQLRLAYADSVPIEK